jgi:EXLDI family protein
MTTESNPPTSTDTPIADIDVTKGDMDEFHEVLLKVGPGGGRRQRFFGKSLGEAREFTMAGVEVIRVYRSRKGKYVVHRQSSEWTDFATMTNWAKGRKNWREIFEPEDQTWADYTVDIIDTFEELASRVPPKIYRELVDPAAEPKVEDLDI